MSYYTSKNAAAVFYKIVGSVSYSSSPFSHISYTFVVNLPQFSGAVILSIIVAYL
jgi:hypothetical protein